jgi:hypothetical protein
MKTSREIPTGPGKKFDDIEWSPKAWMSVSDADRFEAIVRRLAARARPGRPLRVVEWGAGKSSLYFSQLLSGARVPFHWLSIEYDRKYFAEALEHDVAQRPYATVTRAPDSRAAPPPGDAHLEFILFDHGQLVPFEAGREAERLVNMDDYVAYPGLCGSGYDLMLVDGRKRRRCMLEATRLLLPDGVCLLHDAYRFYYQCAWEAFGSGRRIGEMLWIGSPSSGRFLNGLLSGLEL